FGDGPLVVIQDDDKTLRVRFDIVKCFVTDSARKGGVACDYHDILVTPPQVPPDGHAERCGKRRACVARTVAIMFALGAQKKTVEPAELAHCVKTIEPPGEVCLDEHDRVLRPAILWNDQRTAAECAEIEERVGLERLIELTGNRALTGFTAPKILWLRKHEPETYARIRRILLPKDYVRLRLTGEHAIDAADASGTLLFDVAHRRWSPEGCEALEIPLDWLPPAHEATEGAGA